MFKDKQQKGRTGHITKKIWKTASTDQRHQNGSRLNHARTEENVTTADELVGLLYHEGQKQTHRSTRQISTKMGIIQYSIVQIIHRDFGLKCLSSSNTPVASYCWFFLAFIFHKIV